ncbi:exonuclease activity, variant 2 [Bonamia ostreae]|uniref:Exonuclease activity, variant 2 n=1 Tax=Bonamia ostreae TaxID=126728 RepID=A0ABV2AJ41_9EUKA
MSLSESNQKSQNSTKKQSVWKTTLLRHYSDFFDYRPVDRTKNFGNYNFRQSTNKLVEKSEKIKIDVCDNIDLTKDESVDDDKSTKKTPFKKPIRAKKILKKATKSADSEKAFLVNKSITIKRIPGHEHKAPQKYRQRFAEKLFSVCSTMFQDKNADVLNVVKQVEKSIASKSNSPNAYKQFCISTLVELKRRKSIEWLIKSVSEKVYHFIICTSSNIQKLLIIYSFLSNLKMEKFYSK